MQQDSQSRIVSKRLDTLGSGEVISNDGGSFLLLSQLLFAFGHIDQQKLVHLEVNIATKLLMHCTMMEEKEVACKHALPPPVTESQTQQESECL